MSLATTSTSLDQLASDINRAHNAAEASYHGALEHALRAGQLLIEAKERIDYGDWLPWLEANFAGGIRSAQGYMRLAREEDAQGLAHLGGVENALKAIAKPRPDPAPEPRPREEKVDLGSALDGLGSTEGALDELEPAAEHQRFPLPGMQAKTWREIRARLDAGGRKMADVGELSSDWSRAEELSAAARELRDAAAMLDELAATLR